ncbi:MAG: hypothetical protein ACREQ5_03630 [Candidatus Dormibacteria bacterium]
MDMSSGTKEMLGDVTAVGTGVLAWMYTSTALMDSPTASLTNRFEDAVANTLGQGVAKQIWPTYSGSGNLTPKVTGFLNNTTFAGIGLLIADHVGMSFKTYRDKLDGLHNIIEGAGWGITIGGAVGGIFDPDATQPQNVNTGNPATMNRGQAGQNVPYPRAGAGLAPVLVV